jgi:2-polyprenyl-3-methyl-5-hydroxy-6-metoxy-1,4-benzoquinol methylase
MTPSCPLCAGLASAFWFDKAGLRYWRCSGCGFVFGQASANANFQQSMAGFEPAYRDYLDASAVDAQNHRSVVDWIETFVALDAQTNLLDVGAGSGKFLRHLAADRPCRAIGIEPAAALHAAYDLGSLGVLPTTLPEFAANYRGPGFDVVTVLDVIEHVPEPTPFARALAAVTRPGGVVFVSTPDRGALLARVLGRRWHHFNRYHFSLFDASTLDRLAGTAGFTTVESKHRGKRFTLGYVRDYFREFILSAKRASSSGRADEVAVTLNLHDVIWSVWRRRP